MLRHVDRHRSLSASWETPDQLEVEETLSRLYVGHTSTELDAYWHLTLEVDPVERLRFRTKQKMYLARYGRQCVLQWDNVDIAVFDAYYEALAEMIESENASMEDR